MTPDTAKALIEAADAATPAKLNAARKRIYWIVRNKAELLRDSGQTEHADADDEAWETIHAEFERFAPSTIKQLAEAYLLQRARIEKLEAALRPFATNFRTFTSNDVQRAREAMEQSS